MSDFWFVSTIAAYPVPAPFQTHRGIEGMTLGAEAVNWTSYFA